MKKTRVKEQIAGPRVITKRGSKTATRRSASASSERAEQGSSRFTCFGEASSGRPPRRDQELQLPATGCGSSEAARVQRFYTNITVQQVASQRPDSAVRLVTPCPRPPAAVEDHLTKSPVGDTEERQAKLCTVAVRFLGARCIQKDPSSPIQKLASKTRTIIAPRWLRNWAHRVSKHVRHQTCTQKPHGCASLLLRATLGLRIHWDPLEPSRGPALYMWRARDWNGGQFTTRKSLQRGAHLRGSSLHLRGKEQIQKVPRNRYSKIEPNVSESYRGFSQLCAPKVLRALRIVSYKKVPEQAKKNKLTRKFKTKKRAPSRQAESVPLSPFFEEGGTRPGARASSRRGLSQPTTKDSRIQLVYTYKNCP
jgi:hypothetical protein